MWHNAHVWSHMIGQWQEKLPLWSTTSFLLATREGNVFRSMCQSLCSQGPHVMSLPVWSHVPSRESPPRKNGSWGFHFCFRECASNMPEGQYQKATYARRSVPEALMYQKANTRPPSYWHLVAATLVVSMHATVKHSYSNKRIQDSAWWAF